MSKMGNYIMDKQEETFDTYALENDVDYDALDEQITIRRFEDLVATKGARWVVNQLDPAILQDVLEGAELIA